MSNFASNGSSSHCWREILRLHTNPERLLLWQVPATFILGLSFLGLVWPPETKSQKETQFPRVKLWVEHEKQYISTRLYPRKKSLFLDMSWKIRGWISLFTCNKVGENSQRLQINLIFHFCNELVSVLVFGGHSESATGWEVLSLESVNL